jgi:hypothetical protein
LLRVGVAVLVAGYSGGPPQENTETAITGLSVVTLWSPRNRIAGLCVLNDSYCGAAESR